MSDVQPPGEATNLFALPDEQLLQQRLCDLPVAIGGTWVERCIRQLYRELGARRMTFHPPCYLTDEWLCPEGDPVIGVPFVLVHPRLRRLERRAMGEVEGGTKRTLMQLLRHEAGHAVMYAYRLNRRTKWRRLFGSSSTEYADVYRVRFYSKAFVRHLPDAYAQSHPDEDFAETFAVWLTPRADWRAQYRGWKALQKLEYVDTLMTELAGRPPLVPPSKRRRYQVHKLTIKLGAHFTKKRREYREWFSDFHDPALKRLFAPSRSRGLPKASTWLTQHQHLLRVTVARWTGERRYTIGRVLNDMVERCQALNLRVCTSDAETLAAVTAYVARLAMNYRYTHSFAGET